MAIPSFYCDELSIELLQAPDPVVTLSESESSHAVRARRLREGQAVNVLNGQGLIGHGCILTLDKRAVQISFESHSLKPQAQPRLTIAAAIPKGDRQKVMVDMLTQIGVAQIIPLQCEHSVTRYSDNLGKKWQRAAIESCKQSQNSWLPVIGEPLSVEQLIVQEHRNIVYADAGGQSMLKLCQSLEGNDGLTANVDTDLVVIIGPEGGLSENEVKKLDSNNILPISLGNNILRTEAAAITAAAQFVQNYR